MVTQVARRSLLRLLLMDLAVVTLPYMVVGNIFVNNLAKLFGTFIKTNHSKHLTIAVVFAHPSSLWPMLFS